MQITNLNRIFDKSKSVDALPKPLTVNMLLVFVAIIFLALALLLLTWIHVSQMHSGYALAKLEMEQIKLSDETQTIDLELAFLKRPERIRRIAINKLKLRAPTTKDIAHF